jgi:hypothetical protein
MCFARWRTWFANRLPSKGQLAAVYGVIAFIVYGWTIYWYLWKLPSWLYFMTLGELLVTFSYAIVVNFLESLLVLLVPVMLCVLLPLHWFRERFVARGVTLVIILLIALMKYLNAITGLQDFPPGLPWMILAVFVLTALMVFLVGRIQFLCKLLEEIANRATIFIFIFLPLSVISILVVLVRNVVRL